MIVGAGLRARPQAAIVLTPLGREVEKSIGYINTHYKDIDVENAIVMPNHIHLLITIDNIEARYTGGHGNPPLQDIIRNFNLIQQKSIGKYQAIKMMFYGNGDITTVLSVINPILNIIGTTSNTTH